MDTKGNLIAVTQLPKILEEAMGGKLPIVILWQGEDVATYSDFDLKCLVGMAEKLANHTIPAPVVVYGVNLAAEYVNVGVGEGQALEAER